MTCCPLLPYFSVVVADPVEHQVGTCVLLATYSRVPRVCAHVRVFRPFLLVKQHPAISQAGIFLARSLFQTKSGRVNPFSQAGAATGQSQSTM